MNNRNKRCDCGSGKKFKKCCMNKKPRTTQITVEFSEPTTINKVIVNAVTGELNAFFNGEQVISKAAKIDVGYEKPRKKKFN